MKLSMSTGTSRRGLLGFAASHWLTVHSSKPPLEASVTPALAALSFPKRQNLFTTISKPQIAILISTRFNYNYNEFHKIQKNVYKNIEDKILLYFFIKYTKFS